MSILQKINRALRGEVALTTAAAEAARRTKSAIVRKRERANVHQRNSQPVRLGSDFERLTGKELMEHFRNRSEPHFFSGFASLPETARAQRDYFPEETSQLIASAEQIVNQHEWALLGLGKRSFGTAIDWNRDPLSDQNWPRDYHADINLHRGDGSDVRILWELNRLGHLLILARAYAVSSDERYSAEFFSQVEGWREQNPYGLGANWACAMEVGLRAMNLLGAFEIFRHSPLFDEEKLTGLLMLFEQHGEFIQRNLEFSHIATSNHYLSDVTALLWLGLMLTELEEGGIWREFGFRELLREMDKQVLSDGADFEASTGYHRFVLELFLYSFILCRKNNIAIEDNYWRKLHSMLEYVRAYLTPEGRAPLVGDTDGGQVFPIHNHSGDNHGYLLAVGASVFDDPSLKPSSAPKVEEVLWLLGDRGLNSSASLSADNSNDQSAAFPEAGTYILRHQDLYLLFNASGAGINGRGSHGHNDALSICVSACGRSFMVDPGTYVYTANLRERGRFRSTAYHSTVQIDGREQNTTDEQFPFVIGNEAEPRVLHWETNDKTDHVSAEHDGYARSAQPVKHRRTVTFHKPQRWWLVEDEFFGFGDHDFTARFHFDEGLEITVFDDGTARAYDKMTGAKLFIVSLDLERGLEFEDQFTSRDYGAKSPSKTASWKTHASVPLKLRWAIVPVSSGEDEKERLAVVQT